MALFGLKQAGTRTDITDALKKDDEKSFYNYFGRKAKIVHIDNFSKKYKDKKEELSFLIEMSQAQSTLESRMEDILAIIEEAKKNKEPIAKHLLDKKEIQDTYKKVLDENSDKTLTYCPYTKKEEDMDEDKRALSWGKRLRAKMDKDYRELIGMIVDDKSMPFIIQGVENLKKDFEAGLLDSEINYQYMYFLILGAKADTDEGLTE